MEAWIQQNFEPVAQDFDGNDLYGYVCLVPQSEEEQNDLLHFLEDHGQEVDWEDQ